MLTNKKIILLLILTLLLSSCFSKWNLDNNKVKKLNTVTWNSKVIKAVWWEVTNKKIEDNVFKWKDNTPPLKPNIK